MVLTPERAVAAPRPVRIAIPPKLRRDAVTLLSVYIFLLVIIPSRFVVGPLGAAGTPAALVGELAFVWWLVNWITRSSDVRRPREPLKVALLVFAAAIILSYAHGMMRAIPPEEVRSADRGLMFLASWSGVALLTMDGVVTRARLETLIRRYTVMSALVAALAIAQFLTKQTLVDRISIPGLTANSDATILAARDGLLRPAATAIHPLEFAVLLTMSLPLALYVGIFRTHLRPIRRWWPAILIAGAIPLTVSRTAVLCSALVAVMVMIGLPRRLRGRGFFLIVLGLGALATVLPSVFTILTGLFTGVSSDSSAQSRTGSYGTAGEFIHRSPWIGRGFGTFLPAYRILDNQWLGMMIEAGVVGVAATAGLLLTAVFSIRFLRRIPPDPATRFLAWALAAGVASGGLSFAFFDGLSFPMVPGSMFLLMGGIAALRRLSGAATPARENVALTG